MSKTRDVSNFYFSQKTGRLKLFDFCHTRDIKRQKWADKIVRFHNVSVAGFSFVGGNKQCCRFFVELNPDSADCDNVACIILFLYYTTYKLMCTVLHIQLTPTSRFSNKMIISAFRISSENSGYIVASSFL